MIIYLFKNTGNNDILQGGDVLCEVVVGGDEVHAGLDAVVEAQWVEVRLQQVVQLLQLREHKLHQVVLRLQIHTEQIL